MKFNLSYPVTGAQKTIEVDDERKIRNFIDKRLSAEVDGEALGDQFKGYVFKISGGFDKQGFTMKQGVLVPGRVRLLLGKNSSCYKPRRDGERKRKSVRGCIVSNEISVLNLVIVKKGAEELPGLTDKYIPRRLGPKRASKIRKLFNLGSEDDVRKYVIRRELVPKAPKEGEEAKVKKTDKKRTKAPKIQRLVTPLTLQRKRRRVAIKKRRASHSKAAAAEYAKLLAQRAKEARASVLSKRRSVLSVKEGAAAPAAAPAGKDAKKAAPVAKPAAAVAGKGAAKPAAKPAAKEAKPAAKPAAGKPAAAAPKAAAKPAATAKPAAAPKPAAKTEAKPAAAAPAKPKAGKAAKK